jgi:hypothetical protein
VVNFFVDIQVFHLWQLFHYRLHVSEQTCEFS